MALTKEAYAAMRVLVDKPMTALDVCKIIGGNAWHASQKLERLVKKNLVYKQADKYRLTTRGVLELTYKDGIKYEVSYPDITRIHPNVDWPWVYREAA